jgi:hypothetical protein
MSQEFRPGDFLIFQLESGYGLLRFLANTQRDGEKIWHLAAYNDLFFDADSVEAALEEPEKLSVSYPHLALTTRAFESTQVAGMGNVPLNDNELRAFNEWAADEDDAHISDRSVRLLLGLR